MNFLWPHNLWLMLSLPLLPAIYLWLLRRRGKHALRLSSIEPARQALPRPWRRHVPAAILFVALAVLLASLARPTTALTLPWSRTTILLAIDSSVSMRVRDVKPTRMAAAQEAAKTFVQELPAHVDVGIVSFAASAQVAQQATLDRAALLRAIDALQMQIGTAVGSAIVVCLAELFPRQGIELDEMNTATRHKVRGLDLQDTEPPQQVATVLPGSYDSAAIILLTDGRRTTGVDTLQAAKMAAGRGVRIYAVGLGTLDGNAAGGEGMGIYMQLDEPTLREVARLTGGEYFHAGTAEHLRGVYQKLGSRLQMQTRETELSFVLAGVGTLLILAAATLSLLWFGRVA